MNERNWFITEKLFAIPDDEQYILFAPTTGDVLKVNQGLIGIIQHVKREGKLPDIEGIDDLVTKLTQARILAPKAPEQTKCCEQRKESFWTDHATIFPSTDCNLRCTYCYSEGGERYQDNNPEAMFAAVDFIVKGALAHPDLTKRIGLSFHGGGEPLLERTLPTVKSLVAYAKEQAAAHGLAIGLSVSTNGVMSDSTRRWMSETFDNIQISFDGPEHIQNKQRPTAGHGKSFPAVLRTMQYLEEVKKPYSLRSTVSAYSTPHLTEIVDFFASTSSQKSIHIEPLYECGRCAFANDMSMQNPDSNLYMKEFLKAVERGRELGINIYSSASDLKSYTMKFCGAAGNNFVLTPEGDVSTCYEVCRRSDPRSPTFFIGSYDREKREFIFDESKIDALRSRVVDNMPGCDGCFLQYNCAGDCLAKSALDTTNIFQVDERKCEINRTLGKHNLQQKVMEGNICKTSASTI